MAKKTVRTEPPMGWHLPFMGYYQVRRKMRTNQFKHIIPWQAWYTDPANRNRFTEQEIINDVRTSFTPSLNPKGLNEFYFDKFGKKILILALNWRNAVRKALKEGCPKFRLPNGHVSKDTGTEWYGDFIRVSSEKNKSVMMNIGNGKLKEFANEDIRLSILLKSA